MQDTALFAQLLELNSPWKVTEIIPNLDERTITVRIEWPKGKKEPYESHETRQSGHMD